MNKGEEELVEITYSETIDGKTYSASTYALPTHTMPAYEQLKQVVGRQIAYEEKRREKAAIEQMTKDQEWFCAKPTLEQYEKLYPEIMGLEDKNREIHGMEEYE